MDRKSRAFVLVCTLAVTLCAIPAFAQEEPRREAAAAEGIEPFVDLLSKVASCTALILPPAMTAEEVASNERAAQAFKELRAALVGSEPVACSVVVIDENTQGADMSALSTVPTATCTDCDGCLSAASCSGCGLNTNCNASPPRYCRSVKKCTSVSNGHCCGCST